jgi:DNA repair exonuclease SbcCD ATPase subunit
MAPLPNRHEKLAMRSVICLVILAMLTGCGGQLQQLAVETMENAQVALTSANAMGAQETAVRPLRTAEEMLTSAEIAMNAGDAEQAYRLALRAYLHARIATEIAIAIREEARVQEAQDQLITSEQSVAEVLQRLEVIKAELKALQKL